MSTIPEPPDNPSPWWSGLRWVPLVVYMFIGSAFLFGLWAGIAAIVFRFIAGV